MTPDKNTVTLREINKDNVSSICDLSETLSETQRNFVADNAKAIALSHYNEYSWIRAVYLGEVPAGFIELHERPSIPEYLLWRFMIGGQFQGAGVGGQAIELLITTVRSRPNASQLVTSYIDGEGNPLDFYEKQGFKPNGMLYEGEIGLSLQL